MLKTISAVEHDGMDIQVLTLQFEVPDKSFDLMSAIRAAAKDYCQTSDGQETLRQNNGAFNLADFNNCVPDKICKRHGFKQVDDCLSEIEIDWDTQLI